MASLTTFTTVADGDSFYQGYFNGVVGSIGTNAIISAMNASASATNYNVVTDLLGASTTATSSTNWTYVSGEWDNKQSSQATLQFNNMLSGEQKGRLTANTKTAILYLDYLNAGDLVTTTLTNVSFETAGSGGSNVFQGWTNWVTSSNYAWSQATGAGVTAGTYCAKVTKNSSSDNTSPMANLTQSMDFTNKRYLYFDWYVTSGVAGGNYVVNAYYDTTQIYTLTVNYQGASIGATNAQIDLRPYNVTGTHTLKFEFIFWATTSSQSGTMTIDNVRLTTNTDANTTRTCSVSYDGGTNWSTVTPGSPYTFANAITNIGVKIVETKTDASTTLFNRLLGLGVYFT